MQCLRPIASLIALSVVAGCASHGLDPTAFDDHKTLIANFDHGVDADFARGDARLYTAPSYREQDQAQPGLGNPAVRLAPGKGRKGGGALEFLQKNRHAIFYRAKDNIATDGDGLSCTLGFWLNLNPDQDLEPGYCDPIQVTDQSFRDNAVWVDFTKDDTPRRFRLGVFGEHDEWNPEGLPVTEHPGFEQRLVAVDRPPFVRGEWHQVVIVVETAKGRADLYLDGVHQGQSTGITESFRWDLDRAAIRIGVNYVGLFDELVAFDRALSPDEVSALHQTTR